MIGKPLKRKIWNEIWDTIGFACRSSTTPTLWNNLSKKPIYINRLWHNYENQMWDNIDYDKTMKK